MRHGLACPLYAAILCFTLLAACSAPHTDLKSPCAGTAGSPCGPRVPVNDWWLKGQAEPG